MDPRRRALVAALLSGSFVQPTPAQERPKRQPMSKKIPATGESLPVIGLGTWQTFDAGGDAAERARLAEVLRVFSGGGAKIVDSSPMYGSSESVAGDLVAELGLRERLFVATKVWTRGREEGVRQMEESFRRLRVQKMDLMQVHNLVDVAAHTKTLEAWKKEGRVRYLGITHYTASAYAEVESAMTAHRYDFLQINYSLAEREAEDRLLPLAAERGMAVIINRPFAEGLLFKKVRNKPLPPWAPELGIASWAQYFLKWIVGHPAVTCAIPGTGRPEHMRDNLAAGTGSLPDAAARKKMLDYLESF
jgi:aryl-alcohol dehydrogenase-like predicted oxidoreductase